MCVRACVCTKNYFTWTINDATPSPPSILILEEEKPAGVDWFGVGGGSQNSLINYVMEKCLSFAPCVGRLECGHVCEHLFLMGRESNMRFF